MKAIALLLPLVSLGWINPGPSSPPARPWIGKGLDAVIQDRFGHITEADIREGRLGASRVATPTASHLARRFKPANPEEVRALAGLAEEGWSATIYVQGVEGTLTGPIRIGKEALPEPPDLLKVRILAGGAISSGKGLQDAWGPYAAEARPIPVSGPSCAGCHDPSLKDGDPLGAVVYLFHRVAAP